jgi:hypothetical protein
VISVDATSTERRTRAYLDAIATVTREPVRTLNGGTPFALMGSVSGWIEVAAPLPGREERLASGIEVYHGEVQAAGRGEIPRLVLEQIFAGTCARAGCKILLRVSGIR